MTTPMTTEEEEEAVEKWKEQQQLWKVRKFQTAWTSKTNRGYTMRKAL